MDKYSILDEKLSQVPAAVPAAASKPSAPKSDPTPAAAGADNRLGFPGEDGGKSLGEIAQRDLEAALQLLADRAQYITAASGAAIAMRDREHMVCRASAGPSAPELGTELQVNSGLSGESVRTRQILRCDDSETDPRVNRESCRAMGIASVIVLPLLANDEVVGVFELFSSRPYAFEERDVIALQRLAEMIRTALEHADAVKRAAKELAAQPEAVSSKEESPNEDRFAHTGSEQPRSAAAVDDEPILAELSAMNSAENIDLASAATQAQAEESPSPAFALHGVIRKCESCGFPVSQGRTLCVDCETGKKPKTQPEDATAGDAPAFLAHLEDKEESWFAAHKYLLIVLLIVLIAAAALAWLR